MTAKIQYQPLTGPVWREPVASRLSWLPEGQPAVRAPAPNTVGCFVVPFVAAIAVATNLAWLPGGNVRVLALQPRVAYSIVAPFQPPASFDPSQFVQTGTLTVVSVERRRPSEMVEPITAALYRPEGLQWSPTGAYANRPPRLVQTWSLLSPAPVVVAFDPAAFPWLSGSQIRALERRAPGNIVQPFTAALYRPERLEWIPKGNMPWRGQVSNRLGSSAIDPLPHATVVVALPLELDDLGAFRYVVADESQITIRYVVTDSSDVRYLIADGGGVRYLLRDDGAHAYGVAEGGVTPFPGWFYDGSWLYDGSIRYQ